MSYQAPYEAFVFERFDYDKSTGLLTFQYSFDSTLNFFERVYFDPSESYDEAVFERIAFMAFVLAGASYYKCYPTKQVRFASHALSPKQAEFFTDVYRNGLSQFVYENGLLPDDIATFEATTEEPEPAVTYNGEGIIALQSGGKDSLLLASLLEEKQIDFSPWYISQIAGHPAILNTVHGTLITPRREIDRAAMIAEQANGALNGHVPVTFITLSYALLNAVLRGKDTVLAAIGREGDEPHAYIGDYPVMHQWSKTWEAEQLYVNYLRTFISADVHVGSPLRGFSELKIAELFVAHSWQKYAHQFSSCNIANYKQGHDNAQLTWCGNCPKCANSFLLFAPFVKKDELIDVFGKDLFADLSLTGTFKGLLGIDGIMKPFECVGETEELRRAYNMAVSNGHTPLGFDVPLSDYDKDAVTAAQPWASQMIQ
jgi:hypothetical protein